MQRISGWIRLTETAVGIPDLTVAAYDVADTSAENGRSLGTVVTDADGRFSLVRPAADHASTVEIRIVVRGPQDDARHPDGALLYSSKAPRRGTGTVEEFLINIRADALAAADLTPPLGGTTGSIERPASAMHGAKEMLRRRTELAEEMRTLAATEVARERERAAAFETDFRPSLFRDIAGHGTAAPGYVEPDATHEQVRAANWDAVTRSANREKAPVVGYVQVAANQIPASFPAAVDGPVDVEPDVVERYLFGSGSDTFRSVDRLREDPAGLARAHAARKNLLEDALATPPSDGGPHPPAPAPATADPALTLEDLPAFVHRLVDGMIAPDGPPLQTRVDHDVIHEQTKAFAIRGGPADVPAVYDFNHLQIAFDHVWTHAIDEQVLRLSSELFAAVREKGGDPVAAVTAGVPALQALRAETRLVHKALAPQVPPAVAKMAGNGHVSPIGELVPGEPVEPGMPPIRPPFRPPGIDVVPPIGGGVLDAGVTPRRQPHELLDELESLLHEQYKFEIFAPGSINFGLNVTYRQRWEPLTYQVGDLIKTITLTPRETRKVTTKRVRRKERMVREMENSLQVRRAESSQQGRDEAEVVRRAQSRTSFGLAADGSYDLGIASGDSKTSFTKEAGDDSADTKRAFREAVLKAAQEYRDERKLEVESKEYEEVEATESTEISNPNDELTVTYLFYELQRRFRISEQLHRLTPVVLVGLEVPNPSRQAIDRTLLTHSWIINRILLDDRYRPALQYLTTTIVGDELALRERLKGVNQLRATVQAIERNHAALVHEVKTRNSHLEAMMELRAKKVDEDAQGGLWDSFTDFVVGEGAGEDLEAVRIREENARAHYEKSMRAEQELRESLRSETAMLNKATAEYAEALAGHSNQLLEVAALRVHFKANVLYYMQGIWNHTFRDQTYFAVHKLKAPALQAASRSYEVERLAADATPAHIVPKAGHIVFRVTATRTFRTLEGPEPADPEADDKTLAEIADLDRPLGFKGNYMIFPLKRSNALTDFMMTPYVDDELGLHDPDELGSWTPEDFVECVKSLRDTLPESEFDELLPRLKEQFRKIISAPRRPVEEVTIPSDSLYVEALPGKHPNLEDFKLFHRAVDVNKARAEVRRLELENLRFASRVLAGERGDPEIEKQIRITGGRPVVVPPEI